MVGRTLTSLRPRGALRDLGGGCYVGQEGMRLKRRRIAILLSLDISVLTSKSP